MARRTCRGRTGRPAAPLIRALRGELLGQRPQTAAPDAASQSVIRGSGHQWIQLSEK